MSNRSLEAEIQRITPARARELLEGNHVNRKLRHTVVDAYRRDMEAGRWKMTGEPIQLSRTGQLLNGQHRLTALADANGKAKRGVDLLVVSGLPEDSQAMMDQGAARGIADALKIAHGHVKNVTVAAVICRWQVVHPDPGLPGMLADFRRKVSTAEAVEKFSSEPDIAEAASRGTSLKANVPGSISGIGYSWLHMNRVDPAACNEFFGAIVDLSFSMQDDPRKAALRRLTAMVADREVRADRMGAIMLISVLTRAWNAWRKGEELPMIMARNSKGEIIDPVTPI